jgi:CDP-diacylglycerol--glycerol-3-phosphate 3-phosphatidyltransferase
MHRYFANLLTSCRILIASYLYYHLSLFWYFVACITDFFDGYIARRYQIISRHGAILDQVADKMLCWAVALHLCSICIVVYVPTAFMILRDCILSALRLFGHVSSAGISKLKTFVMMTGLALLVASVQYTSLFSIGYMTFCISVVLAWVPLINTHCK